MLCAGCCPLSGNEGGLQAPKQSTWPIAWLDSFSANPSQSKETMRAIPLGLTKPGASADERQYPHKGVSKERRYSHGRQCRTRPIVWGYKRMRKPQAHPQMQVINCEVEWKSKDTLLVW